MCVWADEIKLRAERRAGEMLKKMVESGGREKQGGDRAKSHDVTLHTLGITRKQSSRWQEEATVPELSI